MIARVLVLVALLLGGAALAPHESLPAAGEGAPEFTIAVVDASQWAAEPMLVAADDGRVYATAASGFSRYAHDPDRAPGDAGQSYVWSSLDGGATWRRAALAVAGVETPVRVRDGAVGIEGDLDVAANGDVLNVDLVWRGGATFSRSADGGVTWTTGAPAPHAPVADRPWVTAGAGDDVYVTMNPFAVSRSTDGGATFPPRPASYGSQIPGKPVFDAPRGLLVVPVRAEVVAIDAVNLSIVSRSRMPGIAPSWPGVEGVSQIALGSDGTWHAAFLRREGAGTSAFAVASRDAGATWDGPWRLNAPNTTAAWFAVGAGAGRAGYAWYETPGVIDPTTTAATWTLRAAFADGAGAPGPSADVVGRPVHVGRICLDGSTGTPPDPQHPCNSATGRKLLDFIGADVARDGTFLVAFTQTTLEAALDEPRIVVARSPALG